MIDKQAVISEVLPAPPVDVPGVQLARRKVDEKGRDLLAAKVGTGTAEREHRKPSVYERPRCFNHLRHAGNGAVVGRVASVTFSGGSTCAVWLSLASPGTTP
ncbi:hypothetical protein [Azospirillum endophyticum]